MPNYTPPSSNEGNPKHLEILNAVDPALYRLTRLIFNAIGLPEDALILRAEAAVEIAKLINNMFQATSGNDQVSLG